jgi:hypothetical protein
MGTPVVISVSAKNLVAPKLKGSELVRRMEPIEGNVFFLLDTGADVTCLSFLDARKIGIETRYLEPDESVIGIGGECCAFKLEDVEIGLIDDITEDRIQFHIEKVNYINVLGESSPKLPSLLGNDILKKFDITTQRSKGFLTLQRLRKTSGEFRIVSREINPAQKANKKPKTKRKKK